MSTDYPVLPAPATPPRRPPKRSSQVVGEHFDSPQKRRRWRKDSEIVFRPELVMLEQKVSSELEGLLNQYDKSRSHEDDNSQPCAAGCSNEDVTTGSCTASDLDLQFEESPREEAHTDAQKDSRPKRLLPDQAAHRLYDHWLLLVPTLVSEYLGYMQRSQGRLGGPSKVQPFSCPKGICELKKWEILCLHFDCMAS